MKVFLRIKINAINVQNVMKLRGIPVGVSLVKMGHI
jgi:hypothetical protein